MYQRVLRQFGIALVAFLPAEPCRSLADDRNGQDFTPAALAAVPDELRQLTDWNGARSGLEQAGVQFTFTYYGDAFGNPTGGVMQGPGYDGRFAAIMDADLEKLAGWFGGTFHASFHQIEGTQFSAMNLDNLMTVSGIEAPPANRLFNLWLGQDFGNAVNLRVGQFTAGQEFVVSDDANLFINSTFGWPAIFGVDMPSGGPNYPEATPGARLQFSLTRELTLRAAVFDGNPAGPGAGNPIGRDPFGVAFRVNDPPFVIVEFAYDYDHERPGPARQNPNQESPVMHASNQPSAAADTPNAIKFGAWINTGPFSDLRYNTQGGLLAVSGVPLQHSGDYALYAITDQELWSDPRNGDRSLDVFLRASGAPSDRNLIDLYADSGISFKGLLPSRPDDSIGLAVAIGRISPRAAAYDRDLIAVTGLPTPVQDYEAVVELTYQWMLAKNFYVQPDLQYIIHPGGNIANPLVPGGTSPIPDALVAGLRTSLRF
jgi:porin